MPLSMLFPKDFMQSTDSTIRVGANATYQIPWLAELTGNFTDEYWYFLCHHCRCSHFGSCSRKQLLVLKSVLLVLIHMLPEYAGISAKERLSSQ